LTKNIRSRGNCGDDIEEMSGVKESTVYQIFHILIENFSKMFYDKFVFFPDGYELLKVAALYSKIGLPGTVGSMDSTHLKWTNSPKNLINLCKGKEKFASLSFQVVCSHTRFIFYCSHFYVGITNDKNICLNDPFSKWCIDGGLSWISYVVYDEDGRPKLCYGGHILVDGGYHKYACFICPQPRRTDSKSVYWSECLESARKDVECVFGILKARFRCLCRGIEYRKPLTIEYMMKCCSILHNMLLMYDGLEERYYTASFLCNIDPEDDDK
jgi:hypothetical protein